MSAVLSVLEGILDNSRSHWAPPGAKRRHLPVENWATGVSGQEIRAKATVRRHWAKLEVETVENILNCIKKLRMNACLQPQNANLCHVELSADTPKQNKPSGEPGRKSRRRWMFRKFLRRCITLVPVYLRKRFKLYYLSLPRIILIRPLELKCCVYCKC